MASKRDVLGNRGYEVLEGQSLDGEVEDVRNCNRITLEIFLMRDIILVKKYLLMVLCYKDGLMD